MKRLLGPIGGKPNPLLFLAPLNGSLAYQDRAGGGTLTGSGAVRYAAAEGARTNYCPNPGLASNSTSYTATGSATVARTADSDFPTGYCFQSAATASTSDGINLFTQKIVGEELSGATVTLHFLAKVTAGATDWSAFCANLDAAGAKIGSNGVAVDFAPSSSMARYSVSLTVPTQTGSHGLLIAFRRKTAATSTIRVSDVYIEVGETDGTAFLSPVWLDPITGMLGTAHASPSVSQAVAWVEEGTTNLIANPSGESATAFGSSSSGGVYALGGGATISRDTTHAYLGSYSVKTVTTGAGANEGVRFKSANSLGYTGSSRTWIPSVYVRGSGSLLVRMGIWYTDSTFTENVAATNVTASDAWTRITGPTTSSNSAKTVDHVWLDVRTQGTEATTFYVDDAQLEEKAYATSYCDGSLGTGYAWSGTAHASSSTRTAATLYRPWSASLVNTVRGHVALRESPRDNLAINGRGLFIVSRWNLDLDDHISMSYNAATFTGRFETNGSGASMVESLIVANEWKLIWMAWDANSLYMGNGSSQTDTTARAVAAAGTVNAGQPTVYFGADPAGSHHNGYIGPVLIADRPLTARERANLHARTSWAWGRL